MQRSQKLRLSPKALLASLATWLCLASAGAHANPVIHVYGPGGPAPAMKEAAQAFGAAHQVQVQVVAGPTPQWVEQARKDADVVFSGAENMMSDFAKALPGAFELKDAQPLYLRPVAMLVRPGNPKHIQGFRDVLAPGVKVLAVAGAGQTGLWEDVAGRTGDIRMLQALRKNLLLPEAANSAEARKRWLEQPDIDVWLIWNIWQVSNPKLAEQVAVEEPYRIYRDTGIAPTTRGKQLPASQQFIAFLQSPQGATIFQRWGWTTNGA